jgi:AcrR family transcriptional regulator
MPKIVDHDAMRVRILTQSFALFATKGVSAVTMRGIAREVGVSTGTLYHYFETKDHLFAELVKHYAADDIREVIAALPGGATPLVRLHALMRFVAAAETQLQRFILVMLDDVRQRGGARAVVIEGLNVYRDAISDQLGDLDPDFGTVLLDVLLGGLVRRLLDPNSPDVDEQERLVARVLTAFPL